MTVLVLFRSQFDRRLENVAFAGSSLKEIIRDFGFGGGGSLLVSLLY